MADAGNDSDGMTDMLNGPLGLPPDKITLTGNCPDNSVAVYSDLVNSTLTTANIVTNNMTHVSIPTIIVYYVDSSSGNTP